MEEPKGSTTPFGAFRVRLYWCPERGQNPAGWRGGIAGNWNTDLCKTEAEARKLVAEQGLAALEPMIKALKDAKSKDRSR